MNARFGPWTTSLDALSSARLSANWRHRIERLPAALQSVGRLALPLRLSVVALAVIMAAIPAVSVLPLAAREPEIVNRQAHDDKNDGANEAADSEWIAILESLESPNILPGTICEPDTLLQWKFGPAAKNGLRAALDFEPRKNTYAIGEVIQIQVVLHNAGEHPLQIATEHWRQSDRWKARDANDNDVKTRGDYVSVFPVPQRYRLEPGQIVKIAARGAVFGEQASDAQRTASLETVIDSRPGDELRITWEVPLPDFRSGSVPGAEDWVGTLETGEITLFVTEQADGGADQAEPSRPAIHQPAERVPERDQPQIDFDRQASRTPWTVFGRVTDVDGKPMPDVAIRAATGHGTLLGGGSTTTDAEGRYRLDFGQGFWSKVDGPWCQAASIFASKQGYFEQNLCRQGGCVAAVGFKPGEPVDLTKLKFWGKPVDKVFLPGVPKEINYVLVPAARVAGRLVDAEGRALEGYSVSLTGKELPPSSNVLRQVHTDAEGRFAIDNIPTGYAFQFLIEPAKRAHPWRAWASRPLEFARPGQRDLHAVTRSQDHVAEVMADHFEIQLKGPGVNWKQALQRAAESAEFSYQADDAQVESKQETKRIQANKLSIVLGSAGDE